MVIVRRSILTILSITGIRTISPGPFVAIILPRRKMTPLSYSLSTLMAEARNITTKTITTTNVYINTSLFLFFHWFHLEFQMFNLDDPDFTAPGYRNIAEGIPVFTVNESLPLRMDIAHCNSFPPCHPLLSSLPGPQLRLHSNSDNGNEKERGYQNRRNQNAPGNLE